ncbi:MAG: hypothetical protein H9534_23760 [Dolichospermum circinale Clear-D4]|nr:hypothetical protein [Dolichospermum circinale Clear-D4]
MVTIVVLINIIISLLLLCLAQKLGQAKDALTLIADLFNQYERASYAVLHTAVDNIYLVQEDIEKLSLKNQILQQQIQQIQQIISLIIVIRQISTGYWLKNKNHPKFKNPGKLG